jgi:hypothetical protein
MSEINTNVLPRIIGITGRKFNGKDTLGKYFMEKHGFKRLGFADPLKEACRCIFGFTDDQLYGGSKETCDDFWKVQPRKVLQFIGTDLLRDQLNRCEGLEWIDKSIWTNVMKKSIIDKLNGGYSVVVTDVRFENEASFIREMGGIVLRVTRNVLNDATDTHASEAEIDRLSVDHDILNNGSIDSMYDNVVKLFQL